VVSGVSLKIQDAAPIINSTNAIRPATGYAMTVFTVSGEFVLECCFDVVKVMMVMMMMVVVVLVVLVVGGGGGDGCNVTIVLNRWQDSTSPPSATPLFAASLQYLAK
jgi:hypothetical protein